MAPSSPPPPPPCWASRCSWRSPWSLQQFSESPSIFSRNICMRFNLGYCFWNSDNKQRNYTWCHNLLVNSWWWFFIYKHNLNFRWSFHSLNLRIKQSLPLIPGALPLKSGGAPETRGTRFPHIVRLKYIRKHFVVPIVTTSHNTRDGQSSHSGPWGAEQGTILVQTAGWG